MQQIWTDSQIGQEEWDSFVANCPSGHLLQTQAWGQLKSEFGWQAERVAVRRGPELAAAAQILFRRLPLGWHIAYVPKGPVFRASSQPVHDHLHKAMHTRCRARRAILLKIEPDLVARTASAGPLSTAPPLPPGYQPSAHAVQPMRTILVDIRPPEKELLAAMKSKTRYNIRLAGRKGVQVKRGKRDDLDTFTHLMSITGERDDFGVRSAAYYRRAWELFEARGMVEMLIARVEKEPIAALMAFACGKKAWYLYGASSNRHRETMPNYALQWEAIRWAKSRGCETYDLYGVPDHDLEVLESSFTERSDGLWGVYRFKRGFGGEVVRYAGAYDYVYNRPFYWLYHWLVERRSQMHP